MLHIDCSKLGYGAKRTGPHKIGSRSLQELIDTHPIRAHIHGHSHSGFGRNGIHFNVASARRKRAIWIDLETLEHEVVAA